MRLLLIFLLFLAPVACSQEANPPPEEELVSDQWRTYTHDDWGFSIDYPPGWRAKVMELDRTYLALFSLYDGETEGCDVYLDPWPLNKGRTPERAVAEMTEASYLEALRTTLPGGTLRSLVTTRLDGQPASQVVIDWPLRVEEKTLPMTALQTTVFLGRHHFAISCDGSQTGYPGFEPKYRKITSSFRFLR